MKLLVTGLLMISLQANRAFSQFGSPSLSSKYNEKYIQSAAYSPTPGVNRFSLLIPSQIENRSTWYRTVKTFNNIPLYQRTKNPLWQNLVNLAGNLTLSAFAERHGLHYNSPVQPFRYPDSNNH